MRIYHLNLLVYNKLELSAEDLYQATALVHAECPFESLFFLQNYLLETDLVSSGNEEITDLNFFFRIENFPIEEDTLVLSA